MKKSKAFVISFMLCVSLAAFTGCSAGDLLRNAFSQSMQKTEYSDPTDKWRNEYVSEYTAQMDAINGLLSAADSGDRNAFAALFSPTVKNNEKFSAQLDSFFEAYPNGFSECALDDRGGSGSGSYNYGDVRKTSWDTYTCRLDDEWYHISVHYCYQNTTDPDEVGIDFFCIEDLEANALDRGYSENDFIVCSIVDSSKVTARLIGGYAFVFEPAPDRSVTLEQMRDYLEECDTLSDLSKIIGEPNVEKKYSNATGYDYYYELTSSDGSPLYALIVTSGPYGRMLYGFVCTDEETLYDVFLMDDRTSD